MATAQPFQCIIHYVGVCAHFVKGDSEHDFYCTCTFTVEFGYNIHLHMYSLVKAGLLC